MLLKGWLIVLGIAVLLTLLTGPPRSDPRETALAAACTEAAMRLPHPGDASWPHLADAQIVPLGEGLFEVRSDIAFDNGFGMRQERDFVARVRVPAGSKATVESLQFSP